VYDTRLSFLIGALWAATGSIRSALRVHRALRVI